MILEVHRPEETQGTLATPEQPDIPDTPALRLQPVQLDTRDTQGQPALKVQLDTRDLLVIQDTPGHKEP